MQIESGSSAGFGSSYIAYRANSSQVWSALDKSQVKLIQASYVDNYQNQTNGYPYQNKCSINIPLGEGRSLEFDVQDVDNQSSWTALGGTQAALQKAVVDISNW